MKEVHVSSLQIKFEAAPGPISPAQADALMRALAPGPLLAPRPLLVHAEPAAPLPFSSQLSDDASPLIGVATPLGPAEIMAALASAFADHEKDARKIQGLTTKLHAANLSAVEDAQKISRLEAALVEMALEARA